MSHILWMNEPGFDEPSLVGGKAANLGKLAQRFPVPPAFCLSAGAYDLWSEEAAQGKVPEALSRLVAGAYSQLSKQIGVEDPAVAVRSSAVDEDGADAAFAGIYVSYLNVRGADKVLDAVARCWASASDPRVIRYREERGLKSAGVGVLVQDLVIADSAAVVFSANPMTGNSDEILINANYGLGESVVGGLASPDSWLVRKSDRSMLRFTLGQKEHMTILSEGGTREIPVMRTLRGRPCLSAAQIAQLVELVLRLESVMGWAVDIECAYRKDALYLLQCRPITTGRGS